MLEDNDDDIMDEVTESILLEALLELSMDDERDAIDDEIIELEEAVDDAALEDGVIEDSVVDADFVEDISVVADPLETVEEAELAAIEEAEGTVDAAEDESRLLVVVWI